MDYHQVLFLLQGKKISQFRYHNGELDKEGQNRLLSIEYSAEIFWKKWEDVNQFGEGDRLDALFLSDTPDAFVEGLPDWAMGNGLTKTKWRPEDLETLAGVLGTPFTIELAGEEFAFGQKIKGKDSLRLHFGAPSLWFVVVLARRQQQELQARLAQSLDFCAGVEELQTAKLELEKKVGALSEQVKQLTEQMKQLSEQMKQLLKEAEETKKKQEEESTKKAEKGKKPAAKLKKIRVTKSAGQIMAEGLLGLFSGPGKRKQ